jgi:hypothetical protein
MSKLRKQSGINKEVKHEKALFLNKHLKQPNFEPINQIN